MKVKVIKCSYDTYWYADQVGKSFVVIKAGDEFGFCWRLKDETVARYFNSDDVEIINEEKEMFDMKKDKWYIHTPTQEISTRVQMWLFDQGFVWQHHKDQSVRYTDSSYLSLSPYKEGAFCHTDTIDPKYDRAEINLKFKTVVDSVEFPEMKTPEQIQLDIVMQKITELQTQASELQKLVNK